MLSNRRVHAGAVFALDQDLVQLNEDEEPALRDYLAHPGAVAILALRQVGGKDQICLVNQYRHPVGMRLWEVPAGLLDHPGEDMLSAAKRELAEETDMRAGRWDTLVDFYTSPGCSSERIRIFLARDVSDIAHPIYQRTEEERDMVAQWVALDAVLEAIFAGQAHNPSLLVGALAARRALDGGLADLRAADAPWQPRP